MDGGLELLREANLIVVPGWRDLDDAPDGLITRALCDAVQRRCARRFDLLGARNCWRMRDCLMVVAPRPTGAISSGSLDFFQQSTWSSMHSMWTRAYIMTSAGSAAGIDLLLILSGKTRSACQKHVRAADGRATAS